MSFSILFPTNEYTTSSKVQPFPFSLPRKYKNLYFPVITRSNKCSPIWPQKELQLKCLL